MKFPTNVILDFKNSSLSFTKQYWIHYYLLNFEKNIFTFQTFIDYRFLIFHKENLLLNKLLSNEKKFTIDYKKNITIASYFLTNNLTKNKKNIISKLYKTRFKVKNRDFFLNTDHKDIYENTFSTYFFNKKVIKKLIFYFKKKNSNTSKNLLNIFNINFLKKEKIYTKLKYSRVPQYDIVSGGVAALFAGFLGFLVCEKFGFELGDSGDFYYLFMYIVFTCFFIRLYIKLFNKNNSNWNVFSIKWLLLFYKNIFFIFFNFLSLKNK
jgi:hypothetical protein